MVEGLREEIQQLRAELVRLREAIQAPPKLLLSRLEVAKMLDVSLDTVDRLTKEGRLKAHKIGKRTLFKRNEILDAI